MNFILCGLPKSGKTSVGQWVAKLMQRPFLDTDRLIEEAYWVQKAKRFTCSQIFRFEGERFFRDLENQQIASLQTVCNHIIALGGGSLNEKSNVQILQSIGIIIYLRVPIAVLWERMGSLPAYLDPMDPKKAFDKLASTRMPIYESAASCIIETHGLTQKETATLVMRHMEAANGK